MLATKTFIGKRLDLEHYRNVVMDRSIEIFDEDGDPYDLGAQPVIFELFAKAHGKSLQVFTLSDSTTNEIIFNGQTLDFRPTLYFHECYQMTDSSPSEKILLFYGVSEIL